MTIAQTILDQLGGRRFIAMTGAKNLLADKAGLIFDLPRTAGLKVNKVRVTLTPADTYTVDFLRYDARKLQVTTLATASDVYACDLQTAFTDNTGLATRL